MPGTRAFDKSDRNRHTHASPVRTMQERDARHPGGIAALGFAALGVVFGDIGTSPLYTLKTVLELTRDGSPATVLGVLSLIVWTLIAITSIKYVTIAMRVDNDGEGGILALMALLGVKRQTAAGDRRARAVRRGPHLRRRRHHAGDFCALGARRADHRGAGARPLCGADGGRDPHCAVRHPVAGNRAHRTCLRPGDGGLVRHHRRCWGSGGSLKHPAVLLGLDPRYAISYLAHEGFKGFAVLGGVFLCVTGAEALYADMGHFGAAPIRLAWSAIVFPSLVLNYAGQAAIVLDQGVTADNIFYRLCPAPLLVPMIVLATVATVIASQSIITGAFSMTRQAIQLGWFPRLKITQTSAEGYGQIYVGPVNWLLMVVTIALTVGFGKSDNLAAAYGIAVSATMLMTSALLLIAMREIWQWSLPASIGVAGIFLVIDAAFFVSNTLKIVDGGYVPLLLAGAVYTIMFIWHRGADAVTARIHESLIPLDTFMAKLEQDRVPRVPGTAVFLTRAMRDTPPVLVWHVRHNRALQQHVLAITTVTRAGALDRRRGACDGHAGGTGLLAHHRPLRLHGAAGYSPPAGAAQEARLHIDLADVTYFVGHETVTRRQDGKGLPSWQEALFAVMERNAAHVTDFFNLPGEQVVEIGRQISI